MPSFLILAEADGVGVELECRIESYLEPDVVAVHLDSARADVKFVSGVLTGMPLGDELQDLKLPVGESVNVGGIESPLSVPIPDGHGVDGLSDYIGVQVNLPLEDGFDGPFKLSHGIQLVQIPECSGTDAALGIELLAVIGVNQDLEIRVEGAKMLDELQAILSVEFDLQDHEVRGVLFHLLHGLLGGRAGPGDVPTTDLLDMVREADARCWLSIHDGDAIPWFYLRSGLPNGSLLSLSSLRSILFCFHGVNFSRGESCGFQRLDLRLIGFLEGAFPIPPRGDDLFGEGMFIRPDGAVSGATVLTGGIPASGCWADSP